MIGTAIKAAVIIGGMSWFAANWLSVAADRQVLGLFAGQIGREEPATTGSLGARAAGSRIDPCGAPRH